MERNSLPVAVFDSGVGGISVLRELVRKLPQENFLYFGDAANAPYGDKPTEQVRRLTLQAFRKLEKHGFKAIVVACNTATSAAIKQLRAQYSDMPVIGIEPALKPAVDRHPGGRIVVMATQTTLHEAKFADLIARYRDRCDIRSLPCPGLMEFVERGELDGPVLEAYLKQMLKDELSEPPAAIVLGCTHYPFLRGTLQRIVGTQTELIDGGEGTARETARQLRMADILNTQPQGSVSFAEALMDEKTVELCKKMLG